MFPIAIVGSAEVVIRAVGDKLEGDIQSALNRAAKGARGSGKDAGREFGAGVGDGVSEHNLADHLNLPERDVDREGERTGKRLGDQIGKGVERSRMRSTIIKSFLKLSVIVPVVGALVGGISTLVEGLFAVTSAAGNASSALIVLPGILAAIGAGAITTAIGLKGVGGAISAAFDPDKAKQFQKQLSRLPIAAQTFVKEVVKMRDEFQGVQAAAAEGLFDGPNGLTAQLKIIEPLLPKIAGGFRATGQAVSEGLGSALKRITSDNALENLSIVASTNNHVIRELGKVFGNTISIILAVLSAASPVIVRFSEFLTDFTDRLRKSSEVSAGNNSLTAYFERAANVAIVFIDIVKNIFEGLHDIGKIAFPFGLDLAISLREATKSLADFTDKGENVDRLTVAFANMHDNMLEISGLVKDLGAAFLRLGTGEGVGNVAKALRDIIPDIERLLESSLTTAPAIVRLVGSLAKLFAVISESGAFSAIINALAGLASGLAFLADIIPGPVLGGLVLMLTTTFAISKAVTFFGTSLQLSGLALKIFGAGATRGSIIMKILGGAFKFAAGAIRLIGSAITFALKGILKVFGPIGLAITILGLLAAAFKYAWDHSETFRKVVAVVVKTVVKYFDFLLLGWQKVLGALGKVPGFGWAKTASKSIEGLRGKLNGVSEAVDRVAKKKAKPKVDADTDQAKAKLNEILKANGFVINGKVDIDAREAAAKLAALAAVLANPFNPASIAFIASGGLRDINNAIATLSRRSSPPDAASVGGFGAGGSDSPTPKNKKEKKPPKPPVVNFDPVLKAVGQSGEKFRSALDSFISSLDKTKNKEAIQQANAFKKRFEPFLKAFDSVTDKIKQFGKTVLEVQKSLIEKANPFAAEGGSDINSIVNGLAANQQKIADFAKAVRDLRGAGLNNDTLQQFVAAGPDGLAKAASILRSGPNGIAEINKLAAQVRNNARVAGKESAASGLGAGKLTADGFIQGLKNQKKKLQAQLNELAVGMGQTLAKTLGKSAELRHFPSESPRANLPTRTAKGPTANTTNSIKVTQIYNGPTTGSSRNKELDWTLRYSSPTASDASAAGNSPVGVER